MQRRFLFTAAFAMWVSACASGGTPDPTGALTRRESDVITRGEISAAQGIVTAWDAVQRLRPRFLRNPGRSSITGNGDNRAIVRIDDVDSGLPEVLRTIEIDYVLEIRYYSAVDATNRFGGIYGRGIIHVVTKTR